MPFLLIKRDRTKPRLNGSSEASAGSTYRPWHRGGLRQLGTDVWLLPALSEVRRAHEEPLMLVRCNASLTRAFDVAVSLGQPLTYTGHSSVSAYAVASCQSISLPLARASSASFGVSWLLARSMARACLP